MYKNVCHKIIVYVLVGCLSFGVPATTYYKSVHAIEFLGGALAFEEALKWLLAIVGVTAVGSVASQVDWSEVRDQCVEVQLQQGASQSQVSEWWAKLARGTLDKASVCWEAFLDWSESLTGSSSGGSGFPASGSPADIYNLMCQKMGVSPQLSSSTINSVNGGRYTTCFASEGGHNGSNVYIRLYVTNALYSCSGTYLTSSVGAFTYIDCDKGNISYNTVGGLSILNGPYYSDLTGYNIGNYPYSSVTGGSVSSDWQSAIDVAKENLNLLNRDLPDENSSEVSISMPGLADSDNDASADAYDNIIDAINDGTITLDDGIAQIQDLLHVLVIDDTTDIVQPVRPDPDTGEDQTKEDVIKENKSNMGFTLAGLEKVFPFCIPFDIYAFMTLLVADPVAPEFDFPIKSVNNQTEEIHIDLSPFEPVAVVVRYIFDFLFIIGLALMTRSLIGGGSSD